MADNRRRTGLKRQDDAGEARTARKQGHASSDAAADAPSLEQTFLLLAREERLVLIWKKAEFTEREIAKYLSRPASAIREVHRTGVPNSPVTGHEAYQGYIRRRSALNCPMCGVRLMFRGPVNDCQAYTCAVHGGFRIERNGRFQGTAD